MLNVEVFDNNIHIYLVLDATLHLNISSVMLHVGLGETGRILCTACTLTLLCVVETIWFRLT